MQANACTCIATMKSIKRITLTILVVALTLISAFSLFACNEQDDEDVVRDLYIYDIEFEGDETQSPSSEAVISDDSSENNGESGENTGESSEESGGEQQGEKVAIIHVTFSKTDRKLEGCGAVWHSEKRKDGAFYNVSETTVTLAPDSIFSAVKENVPQEDLVHNDVEYNRLKVVLRYDTIYKSIKSNGEITREGRKYVHKYALDQSLESDVFTLEMRTQNAASWYGTLLGCALAAMLVAIGVTFALKGVKWQKTKTKE